MHKSNDQRSNTDASKRVVDAEVTKKPIPKKDASVKEMWEKLRDDSAKHAKTVSDARTELNRFKGLAELSLSRPNRPTPEVTKFDGNLVQKDITVDATVTPPQGQAVQKTLTVTVERCVGKDADGKDVTGRWIVTHVKGA